MKLIPLTLLRSLGSVTAKTKLGVPVAPAFCASAELRHNAGGNLELLAKLSAPCVHEMVREKRDVVGVARYHGT